MGFTAAVRRGLEIVKLERSVYREVAADPHAFVPALTIVALTGLLSWDAYRVFHVAGILFGPILALVALCIGGVVVHFTATLFGGRGDLLTFLRVWGTGWVIGWALIIPVIGHVVGLWRVVIAVVAVEEHYGLERTRAILAVLIPFCAFLIVLAILGISIALLTGLKSWFVLV